MSNQPELKPKHWKALELIEEQVLTYKDIAMACGWSPDYLYDLLEGNEKKCGSIVHLFKAELNKITARNSLKIRELTKDNKRLALYMMNDRLKQLKSKKLSREASLEVVRIAAVLGKISPNVEIGSLSITRNMTKEELANEFRRLTAIAKFALNPKGIQRFKQEGSGGVFGTPGPGDSLQEK